MAQKKGKGKGKVKYVESDNPSSESSSDKQAERKGKGKRKAKYVEVDDDSSESSSDEEFEGSDDSSEEEEESGGLEVMRWGPSSGLKGRPQVHLRTQLGELGGSGLSAGTKKAVASTSAKFWQGEGATDKVKKVMLRPILEDETNGSADSDNWTHQRG